MVRYIKKILFLLFLVFIVELCFISSTIFLERSYSWELPKNINKIVLGHSMTQYAVNDSIYSGSLNISYHGSEINYNFMKLRELLKHNNQIDTVIFGIKPNDITSNRNSLNGDSYIVKNVAHFLFLFSFNDAYNMIKYPAFFAGVLYTPFEALRCYKHAHFRINTIFDYEIGGFQKSKSGSLPFNFGNYRDFDISPNVVTNDFYTEYLTMMSNLCDKHNVTLIFMMTPVYEGNTINNFIDYMNVNKYIFYDFSHLKLSQNSFQDNIHLSTEGASTFSKELDSLLINYH